ncbi:MAG: Ig-like domain-containing protein [Gemmatimonadaceae bacterium]|nr:Ig-like domain-containing protein [Gemmatimonadaceae bacterium]
MIRARWTLWSLVPSLVPSLVLLATCGGGGTSGPVAPAEPIEPLPVLTAMTVTLTSTPVVVGEMTLARIDAVDQKGRAMTVGITTWTSNEPLIATVSADGIIAGRATGIATITARVGTVTAQVAVRVTARPPGPVPVASVSVSPFAVGLAVAQSRQLAVTVTDYAGNRLTDREVSWSTSDERVATVSPAGLVTALGVGTVVVEATSETRRGSVSVSVTAATDTEIVVSIPTPAPQVVVGDTMTVAATVQSLFPIISATAVVGGQPTTLLYGEISSVGPKAEGPPPMGWSAILDLSSLPFGPYALVITATDSRGHRGVSAVPFTRNPRVPGGSKAPSGGK